MQDDRHKRPTIREIVDELKSFDFKNISPNDEIIDELNQIDRIATEKFSLADEARLVLFSTLTIEASLTKQ